MATPTDSPSHTGNKSYSKAQFWEYVDDKLEDFRTEAAAPGGAEKEVK